MKSSEPQPVQWLKIGGLEDTRPLMEDLLAARVVAPPGGLFHPAYGCLDIVA